MEGVGLPIREVAERTGIAAGTIRMWEQRYGFPEPARTASGYRMYTEEDVDALRRVSTLRDAGLARGLAEVHGRLAVAAGERGVAAAAHRVDQVVRGAAAVERLAQAAAADGVAAADVDRCGLARARGVAGERAHAAPAAQELLDQESADVAGGARDERRVGIAVSGHRARYVPKQVRDSIPANEKAVWTAWDCRSGR